METKLDTSVDSGQIMQNEEDKKYLLKIKNGDEKALNKIMEKYKNFVYRAHPKQHHQYQTEFYRLIPLRKENSNCYGNQNRAHEANRRIIKIFQARRHARRAEYPSENRRIFSAHSP